MDFVGVAVAVHSAQTCIRLAPPCPTRSSPVPRHDVRHVLKRPTLMDLLMMLVVTTKRGPDQLKPAVRKHRDNCGTMLLLMKSLHYIREAYKTASYY